MTEKIIIGANKADHDKRKYYLLPYDALPEVIRALEFGARKYGDHNWAKGMKYSRLFSAPMRAITAWWMGEHSDKETGVSHLAHAACCILFLLAYEKRKIGEDDRV